MCVISSAGGALRDLIPSADAGFGPRWPPDGKSVVLTLIDAGNGTPRAPRGFWGEFGQWTGLRPDDSPLLVRDTSSQEIYALD